MAAAGDNSVYCVILLSYQEEFLTQKFYGPLGEPYEIKVEYRNLNCTASSYLVDSIYVKFHDLKLALIPNFVGNHILKL